MLRKINDEDIQPGLRMINVRHHTYPVVISVKENVVRMAVGKHTACLHKVSITASSCYYMDDSLDPLSNEELKAHMAARGIVLDA